MLRLSIIKGTTCETTGAGAAVASAPSGSNQAESSTAAQHRWSSKNNYYVEVRFQPAELIAATMAASYRSKVVAPVKQPTAAAKATPAALATTKASGTSSSIVQRNFPFSYHCEVPFMQPLQSGAKARLQLFQTHVVFSDTLLAVGTIDLWSLVTATAKDPVDLNVELLEPTVQNSDDDDDSFDDVGAAVPILAMTLLCKAQLVSFDAARDGAGAGGPLSVGGTLRSAPFMGGINSNNLFLDAQPSEPTVVALPPCEGREFTVLARVKRARLVPDQDVSRVLTDQGSESSVFHLAADAASQGDPAGTVMPDPKVSISLGSVTQTTTWVTRSWNPRWFQAMAFPTARAPPGFWSSTITVQVLDHYFGKSSVLIGGFELDCATVFRMATRDAQLRASKGKRAQDTSRYSRWFALQASNGDVSGFVLIAFAIVEGVALPSVGGGRWKVGRGGIGGGGGGISVAIGDSVSLAGSSSEEESEEEAVLTTIATNGAQGVVIPPGSRFEDFRMAVHVIRGEDLPEPPARDAPLADCISPTTVSRRRKRKGAGAADGGSPTSPDVPSDAGGASMVNCNPYVRIMFANKWVDTEKAPATVNPQWSSVLDAVMTVPALSTRMTVQVLDGASSSSDLIAGGSPLGGAFDSPGSNSGAPSRHTVLGTMQCDLASLIPQLSPTGLIRFPDEAGSLLASSFVDAGGGACLAPTAHCNHTEDVYYSAALEEGKAAARAQFKERVAAAAEGAATRAQNELEKSTPLSATTTPRERLMSTAQSDGTGELDVSLFLGPQHVIEDKRPYFAPQWIPIYGHPRNRPADWNATYRDMSLNREAGCSYRGRLLLYSEGVRSHRGASAALRPVIQPAEVLVSVTSVVQLLIVALLPRGRYGMRISMGKVAQVTKVYDAKAIKGTQLCTVTFNEELRITAKMSTVIPTSPYSVPVVEQLPDLFVTLVPIADGSDVSNNLARDRVIKQSDPFAFARFPPVGIIGETKAKMITAPLCLVVDPSKSMYQRAAAIAPVAQLCVGMYFSDSAPKLPLLAPLQKAIVVPGISADPPVLFLLQACVFHARMVPLWRAAHRRGGRVEPDSVAGRGDVLPNPYVRVCWATGVSQTGYHVGTQDPGWNEMVQLVGSVKERMDFPDIVVEIWHRGDRGGDLGATTAAGDVFLARCVVSFADAEASSRVGKPRWYKKGWSDAEGRALPAAQNAECAVFMSFEALRATKTAIEGNRMTTTLLPRGNGAARLDAYQGVAIPQELRLATHFLRVDIAVHSLRNLRTLPNYATVENPVVEVELLGRTVRLQDHYGPNKLCFNRKFSFLLEMPHELQHKPKIHFRVFEAVVSSSTWIGSATEQICGVAPRSSTMMRA